MRWIITSSLSPTFATFRVDGQREFAETQIAFGLSADVDREFVLIFRDDRADEDLAFVKDAEALFVHALLERELIFKAFYRLGRGNLGTSDRGSSQFIAPLERSRLFFRSRKAIPALPVGFR